MVFRYFFVSEGELKIIKPGGCWFGAFELGVLVEMCLELRRISRIGNDY